MKSNNLLMSYVISFNIFILQGELPSKTRKDILRMEILHLLLTCLVFILP